MTNNKISSINTPTFYILVLFVLFLAQSSLTLDPMSIKNLIALIILPIFITISFLKKNQFTSNNKKRGKISLLILSVLLLYLLFSWGYSKFIYNGTSTLFFYWISLLALACGLFTSKLTFEKIQFAYIIVLSISSLVTLLQYFGYLPVAPNRFPPEITGWIGHKNTFGFVLIPSIIWTISLIIKSHKHYFIPVLVIQLIAILLSDSRGSLMLVILSVSIMIFIYSKKTDFFSILSFKYRILLYILLGSIILLPLLLWNDAYWYRVADLFIKHPYPSTRSVIYSTQIKLISQKPIFGHGLGSFLHLSSLYWPEWFKLNSQPYFFPKNGHCDYLEILTDTGIVGFILIMYFWVGALVIATKKKSDIGLDILLPLSMLFIHASFSVASRHVPANITMWFLVGYAWSYKQSLIQVIKERKNFVIMPFIVIHITVLFLFARIFLSDYYFASYITNIASKDQSPKLLKKSLSFCPYNPSTLFQTAYISLKYNQLDYAEKLADDLDRFCPNFKPVNIIRGHIAFNKGNFTKSLYYANKELKTWPNNIDATVLKIKSLKASGNSIEFSKLYNHYVTLYKPRPDLLKNIANPYEKLNNDFRYKYSGLFYKEAYNHEILAGNQVSNLNKYKIYLAIKDE